MNQYTGKEKKELLKKIISMSVDECIVREQECQRKKKKVAHQFYDGRESNGKNKYKRNANYEYDNLRAEQNWLKMKINGDEKWLIHFLETTYKIY